MIYSEPVAATNFSFLTGASHPAEMVEQAITLGMSGIGIADKNSVAGVVRAHSAWKTARKEGRAGDFKLIVGARLVFADGTPDIVAYPMTRRGWGRLTRLLSLGNLRAKKGECILRFEDLLEWADEMVLIILRASAPPRESKFVHAETRRRGEDEDCLRQLREGRTHLWLGASMHRAGSDKRRLAQLKTLSQQAGIPLIATNDALYATAARPPVSRHPDLHPREGDDPRSGHPPFRKCRTLSERAPPKWRACLPMRQRRLPRPATFLPRSISPSTNSPMNIRTSRCRWAGARKAGWRS